MKFPWQKKPLTLTAVFDELRQVNVRIRSEKTIENYRRAIARFGEAVGHEPTVGDLADTNISLLTDFLLRSGKAAPTVNNYAKCIKAIWRFACARNYVDSRSYMAKLVEAEPDCSTWSMKEMSQLFEGCERQPGYIGPVRARDWWIAFHMVCWDTAERTGAVVALQWSFIDLSEGKIAIPPEFRKGGQKWGRYRIRPATVAQLEQILHAFLASAVHSAVR